MAGYSSVGHFLHGVRLLLKGALEPALRRTAPAFEVIPERAHRPVDATVRLDERTPSLGPPEGNATLEPVGRVIHDVLADAFFLHRGQLATIARPTPAPPLVHTTTRIGPPNPGRHHWPPQTRRLDNGCVLVPG